MTGTKSALEVKDDMTFIDLTVRQIEHLNTTYRVDVPLILIYIEANAGTVKVRCPPPPPAFSC
jgi:UDP-N-acetylglucosamine pyrophosphorylase